MSKPIKPAATVVVVRENDGQIEVLLLQRNAKLAFAASTWVFPGGKVEQFEIENAGGDIYFASRQAACRETEEETGLRIDIDQLTPISHWTTPDFQSKRFATQFFLVKLDSSGEVLVDRNEIVNYRWLTAGQAISLHEQTSLAMMPPTIVTLSEISQYQNYSDLHQFYKSRPEPAYTPRVTLTGKSAGIFLYAGDSGYEENNPHLTENLNRCEMRDGIFQHMNNLTHN